MELLPGLDGRKMSKSYDNVVPLFEGGLSALQTAIAKVVTDSRLPGQAKEPEGTAFIQLWDAFASPQERARDASRLARRPGLGRGQAALGDPDRPRAGPHACALRGLDGPSAGDRGHSFARAPSAQKAIALPLLARLRQAVGLRRSRLLKSAQTAPEKSNTPPVLKQYREADGLFYVKLTQGEQMLLLSPGFAQGREAGDWWKATKAAPAADPTVEAALQQLREQDAAKAAAKSSS